MDLVEHDDGQLVQRGTARIDHVAQDLGRHDDDACAGVNVGVAGEKANLAGSVLPDQLLELLVAQRLHRGGIEDLVVRVLHREKAPIGVFMTLTDPTQPMIKEAASAGFYQLGNKKYPKLQIITIKEALQGAKPAIPLVDSGATFKKVSPGRREIVHYFKESIGR